jgi:SHS2 domain-containing protein
MKKGFRFLEHTADAYVEAYGESLEEAFGNAAVAMTDVMTEHEKVRQTETQNFEVEAEDEKALLYSWLEELLLAFELRGKIYSRFEVSKITKTPNGLQLRAKAWGEPYDAGRHMSKVGIKAATYHMMAVEKSAEGVVLRFILDI